MVRDVVVHIVEWGPGVTDLLMVGGRWGSGTCSDILTFSQSHIVMVTSNRVNNYHNIYLLPQCQKLHRIYYK